MGNGFWYNPRNTDKITYKAALKYQRCLNKVRKCDLNIQFLHNCKSNAIYSKLIRWKNIPTKNKQYQNAFHACILGDEIKEKHKKRKELNKELLNCLRNLRNSTTWKKAQIIKYSVNCYINKQMTKVKERQNKKLDGLFMEKDTGRSIE